MALTVKMPERRGVYIHETEQGAAFVAWKRRILGRLHEDAALAVVIQDDGRAQIGGMEAHGPSKGLIRCMDAAMEWIDDRGLEAVFHTDKSAIMRFAQDKYGFDVERVVMSRAAQE